MLTSWLILTSSFDLSSAPCRLGDLSRSPVKTPSHLFQRSQVVSVFVFVSKIYFTKIKSLVCKNYIFVKLLYVCR